MIQGLFVEKRLLKVDSVAIGDRAKIDEDIGQFVSDFADLRVRIDFQSLGSSDRLEQLADLLPEEQALVRHSLILESPFELKLGHILLELRQHRMVLQRGQWVLPSPMSRWVNPSAGKWYASSPDTARPGAIRPRDPRRRTSSRNSGAGGSLRGESAL